MPKLSRISDYETTPEKNRIRKLLFNDPVLSGDIFFVSSCHHSEAFTDGLRNQFH
jgi:hypothetical protein